MNATINNDLSLWQKELAEVNQGICRGSDHVFVFSGDGGIPDGWRCSCGKAILIKETCPVCGSLLRKVLG